MASSAVNSTRFVGRSINEAKGADIASASTTNIWAINGNYAHITGTTTITSFGTAPQSGAERTVIFDGSLTITHNATSLICPGGINIQTASGDRAVVRADTTANAIIVAYTRADGSPAYGLIPQNSQSTAYTAVLADGNKHLLHPSADTTARTFTIPANSSVAYPIGTTLTFVNQNSAGVMTIAITTDTMRLAGAGTTGSRTLAANGIATALKITSTEWIISGTGLT